MAEQARWCFICGGKTYSMYHLPKDEDLKKKWLGFIFGSQPASYPKSLVVCAKHFQDSDFANLGAYNSGFASKRLWSTTTSQAVSEMWSLQSKVFLIEMYSCNMHCGLVVSVSSPAASSWLRGELSKVLDNNMNNLFCNFKSTARILDNGSETTQRLP